MKVIFISDTHTKHDELIIPECDILFHSGDWSFRGTKDETEAFAKWLEVQPAKHIVVVPGNHEVEFSKDLPNNRKWITNHCPRANVLIHESLELEGFKIFGSPWTPYFFNWAWNAGRTITEAEHTFKPFIGDLWKDIPLDTQILITHGPKYKVLDEVLNRESIGPTYTSVGCSELGKTIDFMQDLKIHAFGHLHLDGGQEKKIKGVTYINAAVCGDDYKVHNAPIVIDI